MSNNQQVHLWLRHEDKANEHRAALSPKVAEELLNNGFKISVERSNARCFSDDEYEKIGCTLVETGTWPEAPKDTIIIGLKELPEQPATPLAHTHIMFAHCFKEQTGWKEVMSRFINGGGTILDLEFLTDDNGRRVAAFGYHAGFNGAAVGIDAWCHNISHIGQPYPKIEPYANETALVDTIKQRLSAASSANGNTYPKVMVMGALGRCGKGALDLVKAVGIPQSHILEWDMKETAKGGPFDEILEVDIFINCIYLTKKIPAFVTLETLDKELRRLSVLVDVSCDFTSPNNPVPVYHQGTSFVNPLVEVPVARDPKMYVVAIDHLPTMLPRESSHQYSTDLLPTLLQLPHRKTNSVWKRAEDLFHDKAKLLN